MHFYKVVFSSLILLVSAFGIAQSSKSEKTQHLPEFSVDDYSIGLYPFFEILDDYMKNRIGVLDSVEWSNNEEGEGYEASIVFNLKGGHSIADSTYYEHWQTIYTFSRVKVKEVYSLLASLLKQADLYDKIRMDELKQKGHVVIALEDLCCYVEVEVRGSDVTLRFLPSE